MVTAIPLNGKPSNGTGITLLSRKPASFLPQGRQHYEAPDPAAAIPGMPPNFGQTVLPHVSTFQGMLGSPAKVYRASDEALRDSIASARFMRNDTVVRECIDQRQRSSALLDWHLEAEDEKDPTQKWLAGELTTILQQTPRFMQYRENCLHALWYGRYGIANRYNWKRVNGQWRVVLDFWKPINGDKLVFRYDDGSGDFDPDQIGIRVGAGYKLGDMVDRRWKVEATDYGLAYFLSRKERELVTVHKHMIEDGEYEAPESAGRVHGHGIRSVIYWTWYQKQETLSLLMDYIERSALGIEIWYYPYGNTQAEERTRKAATERIGEGRNIILVPRPVGDDAMAYGVERVESGAAGADVLHKVIHEYFGHSIKRYILGQTLTSEASSTGLGSNVASVHLDTYLQIIRYDVTNLEETLTTDVVIPLKLYNFPKFADVPVKFRIDTEAPDVDSKMSAWRQAWEMGCKIKARDVMSLIGASEPDEGDEVLQNPQFQQQPGMGMPGMPGQPGAPTQVSMAGAGDDAAQLLDGLQQQAASDPQKNPIGDQFGPLAPAAYALEGEPERYKLAPGATMVRNGISYRLNHNHRWQRISDDPNAGHAAGGADPQAGQQQPQASKWQRRLKFAADVIGALPRSGVRDVLMGIVSAADQLLSDTGEFRQTTKREGAAAAAYDWLSRNAGRKVPGGNVYDFGNGRVGFASKAGSLVMSLTRAGMLAVAYSLNTGPVARAMGDEDEHDNSEDDTELEDSGEAKTPDPASEFTIAKKGKKFVIQDKAGNVAQVGDFATKKEAKAFIDKQLGKAGTPAPAPAEDDVDDIIDLTGDPDVAGGAGAHDTVEDFKNAFGTLGGGAMSADLKDGIHRSLTATGKVPQIERGTSIGRAAQAAWDRGERTRDQIHAAIDESERTRSEPKAEAKRPRQSAEFKAAFAQTMEDYGIDDEESLYDALEVVVEAKGREVADRNLIRKAARETTGLNTGDIARLENAGLDYASAHKAGGRTGEKMKQFDVAAQEMARQYPDAGLGDADDPDADFGRALWDLLREGPQPVPKAHDYLPEAAALLLSNRRATESVEEFEATPFSRLFLSEPERYSLHAMRAAVQTAADNTDLEPSEAAKAAGNYRKGRCTLNGLRISIENPKGSVRRGTDASGKAWETVMPWHYGYIRRTESEADGDHVDVFLGPHLDSQVVFVVDQERPTSGRFDEHKVMLGWKSAKAAKEAYLAAYQPGWKGLRDITAMTTGQFRAWLEHGETGKPIADQVSLYAKKSAPGQKSFLRETADRQGRLDWNEDDHPRDAGGMFTDKPGDTSGSADEPFSLVRDSAKKDKGEKFENSDASKQKKLLSGMDALPGQQDLFETDGERDDEEDSPATEPVTENPPGSHAADDSASTRAAGLEDDTDEPEAWQLTRGDWHKQQRGKPGYDAAEANRAHKSLVKTAIEAGLDVPEHAVEDYPELRKMLADRPAPGADRQPHATANTESPTSDTDEQSSPTASGESLAVDDGSPDDPDETPREAAARRSARQLDEDYAFARASAVPNAGEDLLGSARHKANEWRGLADAEENGTAAEMVTRDNLFRNEPHKLMVHADENPLSALAMHFALKQFPAKPGYGKYYRPDEEKAKQDRQQYVETYQALKDRAEKLTLSEPNPEKAASKLRDDITAMIRKLRGQKSDDSVGRATATDPYNPMANSLIAMHKALGTYRTSKRGNVFGSLHDFAAAVKEKFGDDPSKYAPEVGQQIAEHAKDVIEGSSINKSFGRASGAGSRQTFKPSDVYLKSAKRKGGRVIDANTVKAGTAFMLDKLKMRGVQWGNYVTDDERQHHLKMASESMADLVDVLGLQDEDASLGGQLGMAIGARGTGTALAHYEPGSKVINLTRAGGVGSLAHEWGHFFDHHVAGGRGDRYFIELRGESGTPMHDAYAQLRKTIRESGFERRLTSTVREMIESGQLSKEKGRYWQSGREVFARSFEKYIQHKLRADDRENTYLAGGANHPLWPNDEEVAKMAPAFDKIFETYRKEKAEPARYSASESDRSAYGYCPVCGGECEDRERRLNGNDTCVNGHVYPSRTAVHVPPARYSLAEQLAREFAARGFGGPECR